MKNRYICIVKRYTHILIIGFLTVALASAHGQTFRSEQTSAAQMRRGHIVAPHQSSRVGLFTLVPLMERYQEQSQHNMAVSTFPVKITVKGRSICVRSDYNQLLPIYTRGGTFYMAMRLTKGQNWLNGLPRGQYLINHQTIVIP